MSLDSLEYFFKNLSQYLIERGDRTPVTFILHGGEALLLPHDYLRTFVKLEKKYFATNGISYKTVVQSNLFKLSDKTLDLLEELDILLGISLDVFGDQRVTISGEVSQEKVLDNVQHLIDRNFNFGAISVLHALNVDKAVKTYEFFNELNISYRILPIFSHTEPPQRMQHLVISHEETLTALKNVAKAQFNTPSNIEVLPLSDYLKTAVRYLMGNEIGIYDPSISEWVFIVNTNGDVYNHGDAYLPVGLMGNIFQQPLSEILSSQAHIDSTILRYQRAETCRNCQFDLKCNQIPLVESIPSERVYDQTGVLQCAIAKPMIQFMISEIESSPHAQTLVDLYKNCEDSPLEPALDLAM